MLSFLPRPWSVISTGILLTTALAASGWKVYEARYGRDCCYPGSPCCHPGSPCCAHAHRDKGT
jgi:hypothetical protein